MKKILLSILFVVDVNITAFAAQKPDQGSGSEQQAPMSSTRTLDRSVWARLDERYRRETAAAAAPVASSSSSSVPSERIDLRLEVGHRRVGHRRVGHRRAREEEGTGSGEERRMRPRIEEVSEEISAIPAASVVPVSEVPVVSLSSFFIPRLSRSSAPTERTDASLVVEDRHAREEEGTGSGEERRMRPRIEVVEEVSAIPAAPVVPDSYDADEAEFLRFERFVDRLSETFAEIARLSRSSVPTERTDVSLVAGHRHAREEEGTGSGEERRMRPRIEAVSEEIFAAPAAPVVSASEDPAASSSRENVTTGRTGIVGWILRNLPFRSPRPTSSVVPEENLCTICMLAMNEAGEVMTLPCNINHKFHRACIRRWLSEHETCPFCRALVGRML